MAETAEQRKQKYIDHLLKSHPLYTPESYISKETAKRLLKLPEQALFWLYHLVPPKS